MRRQRRGNGSRWARGFDWDWAQVTGLIPALGGYASAWIRTPSDQQDVFGSGAFILPKTLTRSLIYPFAQIQGLTAPPLWTTFYLGLIATDGDGASPPPIVDPVNGAHDWIAYIAMPVGYTGGGGTGDAWYSTFQYGTEQGCLDFSSQRKLPPGRGIAAYFGCGGGSAGSTCLFNVTFRIGLKGDVSAAGLGGG